MLQKVGEPPSEPLKLRTSRSSEGIQSELLDWLGRLKERRPLLDGAPGEAGEVGWAVAQGGSLMMSLRESNEEQEDKLHALPAPLDIKLGRLLFERLFGTMSAAFAPSKMFIS